VGKGKRNRDGRGDGRGATRNPLLEMAANFPDSMDDRPQPGRLSEHTADHLRPQVAAWTIVTAYLQLVGDLGVVDPAAEIPAAQGPQTDRDVELRADLAAKLREAHPHMVAGHAEDAREVMTWIRLRWRGTVIGLVFAEAARWLERSGYQPDQRIWFAGAASYLRAMVPPRHAEQALQLLDHEYLVAEHTRVRALPAGRDVAAFALERPEHTVWYATAMRAHPVAAIHAAAALAAWVWAEPGAVVAPGEVALELADRAMKFGQLAPPTDPSARREPVPDADDGDVFVPAWRQSRTPADPSSVTERALAALDAGDTDGYTAVIAEVGSDGIEATAHLIGMWASYAYIAGSGSDLRDSLEVPDRHTRWAAHLAAVVDANTVDATRAAAVTAVRDLPDHPDLWLLIWHLGQSLHHVVTACGGLARLVAVQQLQTKVPQQHVSDDLAMHAITVIAALSTGHDQQAHTYLQRAVTLYGPDTALRLLVWWTFLAAGLKNSTGHLITGEFVIVDPPAGNHASPTDPDAARQMCQILTEILTSIRAGAREQITDLFAQHRGAFEDFGTQRLLWIVAATLGHHIGRVLPPT
jgi:hypothetical protein